MNLTSNGSSDVFVVKLHPQGNLIWAKSFGGTSNDESTAIIMDNNSVLILGTFQGTNVDFNPGTAMNNMSSSGSTDVFVLKLSSDSLNYQWSKSFGGTSQEYAHGIAVSLSGEIYIAGEFSGTCDFDPSTSFVNKTSNGFADFYLLKLTCTGNFSWVIP